MVNRTQAEEASPRAGGMLGKGLNLLTLLGNYPDGVALSDLAAEAGLPTSTAYRLLGAMVAHKFVTFDPATRCYQLGLKVFELGHQVSSVKSLVEIATPAMQRLADVTHELISLAVLEHHEMVILKRIEPKERLHIKAYVEGRFALHTTSLGKSLLAYMLENEREKVLQNLTLTRMTERTMTDLGALREELRRTRERGYGICDEENDVGIRAVGAPILNAQGRVQAALSVATLTFRRSLSDLEQFVPDVQAAAREVGVQLH